MNNTQKIWNRQHDTLNETLNRMGAVTTTEDGFVYIDQTKAGNLANVYARHMSVGHANGWA